MFLDFSDTVTILGNLLDNGITSALDFLAPGTPVPEIRLSLIYQEGNLLLHMDNPCKVKQKPPYGIGMKNVESRVEKYQGTLVTEVREGRYYLFIPLNILFIKKSWKNHADSQQNQQYPSHFFYRVVEYKIGNLRFHKPAGTSYQYGVNCYQKSE